MGYLSDGEARRLVNACPSDFRALVTAALLSSKIVGSWPTMDQWDRDPDALNTPAGIVDLRTGALRPHAFGDYLTKITAVAPAPTGTESPLWRALLDRTMAGDGELFRFLQRVATARYRLVVVRTSTELCQLRVARQFISGAGNADETARITAQAVAN